MKFGASFLLNFEGKHSIEDFMIKAKEFLLNSIELVVEPPFCFIDDICLHEKKRLKKLAIEMGLNFSIHATFSDINIASINKNVRSFALNEVKKSIDFAADLDATMVTFHPGDYGAIGSSYPELSSKTNYESIVYLVEYAEKENVMLGVENLPFMRQHQLKDNYNILVLKEIIEKINSKNLKITWDVGHSNTIPYSIEECFKELERNLSLIHLHDNKGAINGWRDTHLELGAGTIDWRQFFELIRNKANCNLVFELNSWEKIQRSIEFTSYYL